MEYIVVRGAGDLATGVIQKLHRAGFKVVATEIDRPLAVRRLVSLSECIYCGEFSVEDITARRADTAADIRSILESGAVPVVVDNGGTTIERMRPLAVVDAIMAKKSTGTNIGMAGITVALGPGFCAPTDVDCVIETMRGHDLGRLIFNGSALPNTGIPGDIAGKSSERLLRSGTEGVLKTFKEIGDTVLRGEPVCEVIGNESEIITAHIDGFVRGLLRQGTYIQKGTKLGDIDPRIFETRNCGTISDKSRNLGGAALEAILYLKRKRQ